jgi:hypothetical protein
MISKRYICSIKTICIKAYFDNNYPKMNKKGRFLDI